MGLNLKDGMETITVFHDKEFRELDIPQQNFIHPGYLVILAAYINHHRLEERNCFLPHDDYLQAVGLHAALWGREDVRQRRNVGKNYSLVTALKSVEAVDIATSSINSCIRRLAFPDGGPYPEGLTNLMHVVGELHDNVWSHGRSTGFSFAQKSAVPKTKKTEHYLEFALADCGLGFLAELKRAGIKGIETHQDAIEWCIEQGNSSKHSDNIDEWAQMLPGDNIGGNTFGAGVAVREESNNHQGLGLAHLMQLVKSYNGQLILASGDVCLQANGQVVSYQKLKSPWQGVAVSCKFKISDLALEKSDDSADDELADIMRLLGGIDENDQL